MKSIKMKFSECSDNNKKRKKPKRINLQRKKRNQLQVEL